ncbi:MAG: hypothetical protein EA361_17975 [Bacteroidetes bacterium]|nr:MAG: hypothetical protein EA361_17975 [Bacteroidota bacterium]
MKSEKQQVTDYFTEGWGKVFAGIKKCVPLQSAIERGYINNTHRAETIFDILQRKEYKAKQPDTYRVFNKEPLFV